eukprot:ANDGO_07839.mRNA.1 hypothetical protein
MQAVGNIVKALTPPRKGRRNFWILFCTILLSLAFLAGLFAGLSSEEWLQISINSNYPRSITGNDWSTTFMGITRTRTKAVSVGSGADLQGSIIVQTADFLSYYNELYKGLGCDSLAKKFEDAASMVKLSIFVLVCGIVFSFAAFVVVYLSISHKTGFKKPHWVSAGLYLCGCALLVTAGVLFYTNITPLEEQSCKGATYKWSQDMKWGLGMIMFAAVGSFLCTVLMLFKKDPSRIQLTDTLEEATANFKTADEGAPENADSDANQRI